MWTSSNIPATGSTSHELSTKFISITSPFVNTISSPHGRNPVEIILRLKGCSHSYSLMKPDVLSLFIKVPTHGLLSQNLLMNLCCPRVVIYSSKRQNLEFLMTLPLSVAGMRDRQPVLEWDIKRNSLNFFVCLGLVTSCSSGIVMFDLPQVYLATIWEGRLYPSTPSSSSVGRNVHFSSSDQSGCFRLQSIGL